MKKFWIVYSVVNSGDLKRYDTYQTAEDDAKRLAAAQSGREYVILEAVASTKQPVPAIDIIKFGEPA